MCVAPSLKEVYVAIFMHRSVYEDVSHRSEGFIMTLLLSLPFQMLSEMSEALSLLLSRKHTAFWT